MAAPVAGRKPRSTRVKGREATYTRATIIPGLLLRIHTLSATPCVIVTVGELMARVKSTASDDLTLQMALIGYELERQKIDEKIKEIRAKLAGRKVQLPSAAAAEPAAPRKRNLSAAARKRIAMAQKRRWAEHRKQKGQAQGGKAGKAGAKPEAD